MYKRVMKSTKPNQSSFFREKGGLLLVSLHHEPEMGDFISFKETCTYTNTSLPHPAMAVKTLGARSLAGLMA